MMAPLMRARKGQTSIEVLLVVAFVLLVSLATVFPYIGNQHITNATLAAKLTILPFVEKNERPVKISTIQPEASGAFIRMNISTSGTWDSKVNLELLTQTAPPAPSVYGCDLVCGEVKKMGGYSSVRVDWFHNGSDYCSSSC